MITPDLTGSRWFRRVSCTNPFTNRWTVTAANATAMLDLGIPEGLARVVNGACRRSPLSASTAATPIGTDGHLARTPTRWCSPSCCRCSPCTGSTPHGWYSWAGPWAVRAHCCWARGSAQHARRVSAWLARHCGRHTWQPTTAHSTAPPTGSKHRLRTAGVGVDPYPGWTAAPRTGFTRPPGNSSHNGAGQSRAGFSPGGHGVSFWRRQLPNELTWLAS
jgi:hypothetical protein